MFKNIIKQNKRLNQASKLLQLPFQKYISWILSKGLQKVYFSRNNYNFLRCKTLKQLSQYNTTTPHTYNKTPSSTSSVIQYSNLYSSNNKSADNFKEVSKWKHTSILLSLILLGTAYKAFELLIENHELRTSDSQQKNTY